MFYENKSRKLKLAFETGIGYNYNAFKLKWTGEYKKVNETNLHRYSLDIAKQNHQLAIPVEINCIVNNFSLLLGPLFCLQILSQGGLSYSQDGQIVYLFDSSFFNNNAGTAFKLSLVCQLGYAFKVTKGLVVEPNLNLCLPAFNYEPLALGNVNRGRNFTLTQIQLGVKLKVTPHQKHKNK